MKAFWGLTGFIALLAVLAVTPAEGQAPEMEKIDGGFFTMERPKGWEIYFAGSCSDFAIIVRDKSEPLRRAFYFGQIGPVYMTLTQKNRDAEYITSEDPMPIPWSDMPVVDPPSPSNMLTKFSLVADSLSVQGFMPQFPRLDEFKVVSSSRLKNEADGGRTELVRGVFREGGKVCEGQFKGTVLPMMNFTGEVGGGTAYGLMFSGINAPRDEYASVQSTLVRVLDSFSISSDYLDSCKAGMGFPFSETLKAGRMLSDTSRIISEAWKDRSREEDALSEKMSEEMPAR